MPLPLKKTHKTLLLAIIIVTAFVCGYLLAANWLGPTHCGMTVVNDYGEVTLEEVECPK